MQRFSLLTFSRLTILLALVGAFGCQTSGFGSANDCRAIDWYEVGRRDGANGKDSVALEGHRQTCSALNLPEFEMRYRSGRQAGLAEFCQPSNGFEIGKSGQNYVPGVCPKEYEKEFLENYQEGQRIYQLSRTNRGISEKIGSLLEELNGEIEGSSRQEQIKKEILDLKKARSENIIEMSKIEK